MKKIGDLNVNDGKGLFDNEGLCDSLVNDLNNLIKQVMNGQFIQVCANVTQMAQKLINLKAGIKNDMDAKNRNIEELKRENAELLQQITGLPVDKDGAENGNNTDMV